MVGLQIGVDPAGHRSENELRRQLCQRFAKPASLHLTISDLTEKPCKPFEFGVDIADSVPVEQLAEHPKCAAQPADRHPGVVNRVAAAAQAEIALEDSVDLCGQESDDGPARGGCDGRFRTR